MSTTKRAQYKNLTVAEVLRNMPDSELSANARRGGRAAIAEQARRQQWARGDICTIAPDPELDIGV